MSQKPDKTNWERLNEVFAAAFKVEPPHILAQLESADALKGKRMTRSFGNGSP